MRKRQRTRENAIARKINRSGESGTPMGASADKQTNKLHSVYGIMYVCVWNTVLKNYIVMLFQ